MNTVLAQLLETGRVTQPDGTTVPLHSAVSRDEGDALQRLIRQYRPQVTLEVGLAYGVSALFICEALAEVGGRTHITIDPMQQAWGNHGRRHLADAGFASLVEHHEAPSHRVLPALDADGRRIDFAFIDGWHTFDYAMVDFFYIDRLLRPGGVLILDDAWSYRALRKLARYIVAHRRYRPIDAGLRDGPRPSIVRSLLKPLQWPALQPRLTRLVQPDVLIPDAALGLRPHDLLAFEKAGDDVLGDGSAGSRRWDQHHEF